MDEKLHTELPWTLHHCKDFSQGNSQKAKDKLNYNHTVFECHCWIDGGNGPDKKESEANAQFIVKACNTYYQSQQTIKELRAAIAAYEEWNRLTEALIHFDNLGKDSTKPDIQKKG